MQECIVSLRDAETLDLLGSKNVSGREWRDFYFLEEVILGTYLGLKYSYGKLKKKSLSSSLIGFLDSNDNVFLRKKKKMIGM